jgi:hypothetical protein
LRLRSSDMTVFSKVSRKLGFIAATTFVFTLGSIAAFAVPASQVARLNTIQTFNAACCVAIGPTVRLTEPSTVAPVIVTWSTDYAPAGTLVFDLSVNGGPCAFYGSGVAPALQLASGSTSIFLSDSFQWVVLPSDGLKKGVNTFTVCAGGVGGAVNFNIGSATLSVQISK